MVIWLLMLFTCQSFIYGQNRIDSLRFVLATKTIPDSVYVRVSIELCKTVVNTDNEYLLPEFARKGLEADTLNRDIQSKSILHEYLGNYYWQVGKLSEAADQFNRMRLIGELSADAHIAATSYNGLGTVYYLMDENDRALQYYREGLKLSGTDSLLKARIYNNIANTFAEKNELDSVLSYYNQSIAYHIAHQNYRFLATTYGNIALAYDKMINSLEVRKNMDLALEAAIKSKDPYQIISVYQVMGDLAYGRHPDLAIKCYNEALDLARKSKSYDQIRRSLDGLSTLIENTGNYKAAVTYLKEIKSLGDSLDLEHRKLLMRQIESDHKSALIVEAKLKQERQDELNAVKAESRQEILIIVLCGGFVVALFLLLWRMQAYRLRMKVARTKEKFFSMIAHDIRNPFSGILGLSAVLAEKAEKSEDLVQKKQIRALDQSLNQVYDLLENLLQWSQSESGKIAFNPQYQLLSPFVTEVICLLATTAKQKGITIENHIQSAVPARFDSNMLKTVLRNLLSNAMKFSKDNSSIFISAEIRGKEVVVKVRDEGIGMDRDQMQRVFDSNEGFSTTGTRNEAGTGIGLSLCKDFITRHKGKIWAESTLGKGTTVCFTLPD